jgi:hypothetical protein
MTEETKKIRPTCSCGFKIRGKNHEEGKHHIQGKGGNKKKKK